MTGERITVKRYDGSSATINARCVSASIRKQAKARRRSAHPVAIAACVLLVAALGLFAIWQWAFVAAENSAAEFRRNLERGVVAD